MEKEVEEKIAVLSEAVKKTRRKHNFKNHIAVRKETFKEFRELKDEPGSDAFLKKLLDLYKRWQRRKLEKQEAK